MRYLWARLIGRLSVHLCTDNMSDIIALYSLDFLIHYVAERMKGVWLHSSGNLIGPVRCRDGGGGITTVVVFRGRKAGLSFPRAQESPKFPRGFIGRSSSSGNLSQQILISHTCAWWMRRHGAHVQMIHRLFLSVPSPRHTITLINSITTP